MSYNRIILMGNLTRDPQLSTLPSGTPVVEIGIACSRKYKTQSGEDREEAMFIDCRCYGKQAEVINRWFTKGKPILVEGRLDLDQWQDQQGQKRSKHRVFIERFSFVGGGTEQSAPSRQSAAPQATPEYDNDNDDGGDEGGSNIPF